jgi:uncharacterized membrane protein (DUF106 family)
LDYDYFGSLDKTFITLFQMMTTDSWLIIVRQVMDAIPYAYILFFAFVTLTSFIILSLIFAIICESLVDLKADAEVKEMIEDTEDDESRIPLAVLILQQADITRSQQDMEMVINSLLLRLPTMLPPSTNS